MADFYNAQDMIEAFLKAERLPVIFAPEGLSLTAEEEEFFKSKRPFGFILFARNCEHPAQVKELTAALRACAGWHCPILIDQEGGRVMRLKSPHWPKLPASMDVAKAGEAAVKLQARILAKELLDLDIDVDCMPVADVYEEGVTDNCIGDRAYGTDPLQVAALCSAFINESYAQGLTPIIKHMPGHGQAQVDSHKDLPVVECEILKLADRDFLPFKMVADAVSGKGLWGMVAHLVYEEIDAKYPSSLSRIMIQDVIRKQLGYEDALLLSDDINMGALNMFGDIGMRSRMSLNAGLDIVLHCSGNLSEMKQVAEDVPPMASATIERVNFAFARRAESYKSLSTDNLESMVAQLYDMLDVEA